MIHDEYRESLDCEQLQGVGMAVRSAQEHMDWCIENAIAKLDLGLITYAYKGFTTDVSKHPGTQWIKDHVTHSAFVNGKDELVKAIRFLEKKKREYDEKIRGINEQMGKLEAKKDDLRKEFGSIIV